MSYNVLHCTVHIKLQFKYSSNSWIFNKIPCSILVDSPPDRMLVEMNTGTLNIRKVCKDCLSGARSTDLMVIQCNASNTNGYVFGQGYINVLSM